jgi:hypothetical protein
VPSAWCISCHSCLYYRSHHHCYAHPARTPRPTMDISIILLTTPCPA